MRSIIFTILFIIISIKTYGQLQIELDRILAEHNFAIFKNYVDTLSNKKRNIETYWVRLRDLTYQYKEGTFYIKQRFLAEENTLRNFIAFRINFIATEKEIIFYELSEQKIKLENEADSSIDESYFFPFQEFRDKRAYSIMKNTFKLVYGRKLNESELFNEDIVFGLKCGYSGNRTEGSIEIDNLVQINNQSLLFEMLQSTNTEKQFFAIYGFHQLFEKGIKLSDSQMKLINYILNKNGNIRTCSGCIISNQEISEVAKRFIF